MSNPTELPELDRLLDRASKIADWLSNAGLPQSAADVATLGALARRAQPEGEAPQAEPGVMVPKFEGQFDSLQDWVNRAQRALFVPSHKPNAICVDAKGRRCHIGADMRRAKEENAFPVRYFWECEVVTPAAQHAESGALAAIPRELIKRVIERLSKAQIFPLASELRAALVAQSQGAQAAPVGLTRYSMWSNSTACGMDPRSSGEWVSFDEVRDLLAAQQAAAPGSLLAILRDVHDTLASESDSDIDHFEDDDEEREGAPVQYAARKVMEVMDMLKAAAPSAPGTPEAPKESSEPTMLWDADDPEDGTHGDNPQDFAENYACNSGISEPVEVEVLCAYRGGKRAMLITPSEDGKTSWSWVQRAAQLDGGQGEGDGHADQA